MKAISYGHNNLCLVFFAARVSIFAVWQRFSVCIASLHECPAERACVCVCFGAIIAGH